MADLKISDLGVASATTGSELFPVVQGGITKKLALNAIQQVGTLGTLTVSGNATFDTDTLVVDSANNRVGVGIASPAYSLQVRRAGGAGSLGISIDTVGATDRTVQYFAVQDSAVGAGSGHAWYYRPSGSTTDTLGFTLDELGNLVIGTATASATLGRNITINGASAGTNTGIVFQSAAVERGVIYGSSTQFALGSTTAIPTVFTTNNVARATLDTSGNLGLGVTPSAWSVRTLQMTNEFAIGHLGYSRNSFYDGTYKYITSSFASMYQQSSGQHQWFTAPSGTAGNAISFTQAMTLDASGNLGVGTTGTILHKIEAVAASGADRNILLAGVSGATNGLTVKWNHASTKTYVNIANIPTSATGLPAGTLYSDAGTIKIA